MAFQTFRVELKGEDPMTVQTSALDWRAVTIDPNSPKALDMTFRVCHAAMRRLNMSNVPRDYDGFCEMLESIPEAIDEGDTDLLDPTNPDR